MSSDKENQKKTHMTEMGQKVKVHREEVQDERSIEGNKVLRAIGESLCPKGLEYKGSCAVHVYQSDVLEYIQFATQTSTMQDVPELTGATAIANLRSDLLDHYGRPRQTKRSGF